MRDLVTKSELEYKDLELNGPYTKKGTGIQELQDMEERVMVMELAMESNYQFREE
jgi:hypothetical protein